MSRETGLPPSRDGAQTSLLKAWDSASVITPAAWDTRPNPDVGTARNEREERGEVQNHPTDGAHEAWACGPVPWAVYRVA
jgi:hypothetical protein